MCFFMLFNLYSLLWCSLRRFFFFFLRVYGFVPLCAACGRCANCKAGHTGICLNVNPARPGAAYGYVDMVRSRV